MSEKRKLATRPLGKKENFALISYFIAGTLIVMTAGFYFKYLKIQFDFNLFVPLGGALAGLWTIYQWLDAKLAKLADEVEEAIQKQDEKHEKTIDEIKSMVLKLEGLIAVLRSER